MQMTRSRSAPTGSPNRSTAATIRRWSTAHMPQCGLDVTIMQGGPQVTGRPLLLAGKIQFYMGGDLLQDFSAVQQGIPLKVVAADFQKDPQVLMSHPGKGMDTFLGPQECRQIHSRRRGLPDLLPVDGRGVRLRCLEARSLHLQSVALHRRSEVGPAGLRHVRSRCRREGGRLQAQCLPSRRQRLEHLRRRPSKRCRIRSTSIPTG